MNEPIYHPESIKIFKKLHKIKHTLVGGTNFQLGDIALTVQGKDGIGGLIEEWFGVWAIQNEFVVDEIVGSQEFPDYYVGVDGGLLEIKTFDADASANFDIANFESYCISLANNPNRLNSDYLIFSYRIDENGQLSIVNIWLKKIWEITGPSERWALKNQTKRNVIYNIRPATWYSTQARYQPFNSPVLFVEALYKTQQDYLGKSDKDLYIKNKSLSQS